MRSTRLLLLATMVLCVLAAPAALAQSTRYVATNGADLPGCGADAANACRTINYTYVNIAGDGDTIRVMPGNYNECVDATIFALPSAATTRNVHLLADAWATSGDNTATTIDGTGQCDVSLQISTVNIWGTNASVKGFTITGGVASGIYGAGGVTITNNIVEDNDTTVGGGIFFYTYPCAYGDTTAVIADNTVRDNRADYDGNLNFGGDGGGIYIDALAANDGTCTGNADVTVSGNTIRNNTITGSPFNIFGAGMVIVGDSDPGAILSVAVTQNLVNTNVTAAGAPSSYGGGMWIGSYGDGAETITVQNNTVAGNNSLGDGGGISGWVIADGQSTQGLVIDDNIVTGNTANGNGGGMDLFMFTQDLLSAQKAALSATGNAVSGNTSTAGSSGGGGGVLATFWSEISAETIAPMMTFDFDDNRVTGNTSGTLGGGVSFVVTTNADPLGDGSLTGFTTARIGARNNLVADNTVTRLGSTGGGGGIFAYLESVGDAESRLNLDLTTVANNRSSVGSAIEVEIYADFDSIFNSEGQNFLTIENSILSDNDGYGLGGPGAGQPGFFPFVGSGFFNFSASVDYTNLFNNGMGDIEGAFAVSTSNNFGGDPLLAATTYQPGQCSPTIDAGNPATNAANEAEPNQGPINVGHTGGTSSATGTLADVDGDVIVDGVDTVRLSTSFSAAQGATRFLSAADLDGNALVDGNDLAFIAGQFNSDCN